MLKVASRTSLGYFNAGTFLMLWRFIDWVYFNVVMFLGVCLKLPDTGRIEF